VATGPTHAMSGLLAWAAATALATQTPIGQLSPRGWVVGAVLATGAALLPDLDHPGSTVSRTFGSISQGISNGISAVSAFIYRLTRTKRDSNRTGSHRGFTHTVVFAGLAAVGTFAVVQTSEKWALPALMFFFCGLAVRGLINDWKPKHEALLTTVISAGLTALCLWWTEQTTANAVACGVAVAIGCVAHYIGDAITEQGCPMLWPIPLGGKTWFPVAPPKLLRMRTGGKVEMMVIAPLVSIGALGFSVVALRNTGLLGFLDSLPLSPF
jgi:membrane-bound metal-dependent hydrolase YbcI (DUF457 family)